mgnify:CR=1 FL=1
MTKQQREVERQAIIAQLQQLDRHGVWSDQQSKMEGYPSMTLREARVKLAEISDPKNQ